MDQPNRAMDIEFLRQSLRGAFRFILDYCAVGPAFDRIHGDLRCQLEGRNWSRVYIVAIGKAAVPMAAEFLGRFDIQSDAGVLSSPNWTEWAHPNFACFKGGHPAPNADSLRAAEAAKKILGNATRDDLVVFLVSGGGSACFELPLLETICLDDLIELNQLLTERDLDIVEINTIRKHLSLVKGGRLAEMCQGACQVTLYVSDVPMGYESFVASGPSMPDSSSLSDMHDILRKHEVGFCLPRSVNDAIGNGLVPETPKPGAPAFVRSSWFKLLDNADCVRAAVTFAKRAGWRPVVVEGVDDLHVEEATTILLERLNSELAHTREVPLALISGGELISPVRGKGKGGRNQAFVLECVERIAGREIAVLSAGTDGIDGNSLATGALADGTTLERSLDAGVDLVRCQAESDSATFFAALGDNIITGATGTNVQDIRIILAK